MKRASTEKGTGRYFPDAVVCACGERGCSLPDKNPSPPVGPSCHAAGPARRAVCDVWFCVLCVVSGTIEVISLAGCVRSMALKEQQ